MTTRVFPSQRDTWLSVVILIANAVLVGAAALELRAVLQGHLSRLVFVAFALATVAFTTWIRSGTGYEISPGRLLIRCGPFRWGIAPADIVSVTPTDDPTSGPALSLDRLAIDYRKGSDTKTALISPLQKGAFIEALREQNPGIEVRG